MSTDLRAPAELLFRTMIKQMIRDKDAKAGHPLPIGKLGGEKILPPYLGEMGYEIRNHIAATEPWLRSGWKVMTRQPAFYPPGTAVHNKEFFAEVDTLCRKYNVLGSGGGIHIMPFEFGDITYDVNIQQPRGELKITLSDASKIACQAFFEIELRKLYLDWFHYDRRVLTDYDRRVMSFFTTAQGNMDFILAMPLRPSFLPPSFEHPPEPVPQHVGVQLRNIVNLARQIRNSDPAWMLQTADDIGRHLGLPVLVYGHPGGCVIPEGRWASWDPARPDDHMAHELGYLKSCTLMLSPDSGWGDLMGWLQVPTLLEGDLGGFAAMLDSFQPRYAVVDRDRPIGEQVDALLASGPCVPAKDRRTFDTFSNFPWEP